MSTLAGLLRSDVMAKQALVLLADSTYSFPNPTPLTHRWLQNKLSCLASTSGLGIPQRKSKQPPHLKYILNYHILTVYRVNIRLRKADEWERGSSLDFDV